jgi:hypothetical protein
MLQNPSALPVCLDFPVEIISRPLILTLHLHLKIIIMGTNPVRSLMVDGANGTADSGGMAGLPK